MKIIYKIRRSVAKLTLLKTFYLLFMKIFPVHLRYSINRRLRSPYSKLEDENSIIFIHIPKAAGNALIKSIYGVSATGHDPLRRYLYDNNKKFQSYYKFAVVRNPFDRLVSSFFYLKQGGIGFFDNDFSKKYLNDIESFEIFVKKLSSDSMFRNAIMSWVHFTPQLDFLTLDGIHVDVDKVIKLEDIDQEITGLCSKLGLPSVKMLKDNTSNRLFYMDYYNPELIKIVESLYNKDLKALNYSYGD